jgi:hypothetical protein
MRTCASCLHASPCHQFKGEGDHVRCEVHDALVRIHRGSDCMAHIESIPPVEIPMLSATIPGRKVVTA